MGWVPPPLDAPDEAWERWVRTSARVQAVQGVCIAGGALGLFVIAILLIARGA